MEARRAFMSTQRMKSTEGIWIDSIPYHAMIGECMYQMGDLTGALQQYTTALQVFLQHPDWLVRISIPDVLKPSNRVGRSAPTWGTSSRPVRVADIPDRLGTQMGNSDRTNSQAMRHGGVIRRRYVAMVDAKEIVRCTALAIRRRQEILGPNAQYDSLTDDLITQLSRRPAPPANWSQAWISVQLGLAYASKGKVAEATNELNKSLLAAGMDHNLTSTALLELGKLAFHAQDYAAAGTYFFEATYSAAMMAGQDFTQFEIVAEAFRWGTISHVMTEPGTFSKPLAAAVDWARRGHRIVEGSLQLTAAENWAAINEPKRAQAHVERAQQVMRRRECSKGELGAATPVRDRSDQPPVGRLAGGCHRVGQCVGVSAQGVSPHVPDSFRRSPVHFRDRNHASSKPPVRDGTA